MRRNKKEVIEHELKGKLRPIFCPNCGWRIMDAIAGTKIQASVPRQGRYPDFSLKCGHCGAEIGVIKTE